MIIPDNEAAAINYDLERTDDIVGAGKPELYAYPGFYDYDAAGQLPFAALWHQCPVL